MSLIQFETRAAPPIDTGSRRLVPFSQMVRLQLPGSQFGGLIWNRPVAVLAQEANGEEQLIPILDITRQAQIFLLGLGLFGAFLIWLANRNRRPTLPKETNE